jgi:hypothetical protein
MSKKPRNFSFVSTSNQSIVPLLKPNFTAPSVYYTREALAAIEYIVDQVDSEVGWFGLVDELDNGDYLITDIYIPQQIVSGVTVDMTPNAIAELAHQLMEEGKDPSKLRYEGHSHVNMAVNPSGTDEEMVDDFLADCPYFIRGIYNKKNESRVDVFDKTRGLVFNKVDHGLDEPELPEEFYEAIDDQLDENVKTKPVVRTLSIPDKRTKPFDLHEEYDLMYGEKWRDSFYVGDY